MKKLIKPAALSALAALTITSCGSGDSSSSLPDDSSAVAPATTTTTTTTAAVTTPAAETTTVTTTVTTAVSEADVSSLPEEDSSVPKTELTEELFKNVCEDVDVRIEDDRIIQTAVVNDIAYSLTIDLSKWEHNTSPEDMVQLSRLFWQSYPRMYERFGEIANAPYDVTLAIENEGYAVAEAGGNFVHLHDMWLPGSPEDYDCITHELGHIVSDGSNWDSEYLEFNNYIELFAEICRYEYALDNGYFNDAVWTLQTTDTQNSRETSVRFLLWLDYNYSDFSNGIDLMYRFCDICFNSRFPAGEWNEAWQEIFRDTALEGLSVDEVWKKFADSDFARLSADAEKGGTSELAAHCDLRKKVKETET